jgi:hypothetical protein
MRRARTTWLAVGFFAMAVHGASPAQDTVRVRADGKPRWGESARLVPELAIGTLDGDASSALGEVTHVIGDAAGRVYVFDHHDDQIRQYDGRGRFLGNVGRRGSGPGEYQYADGLAIVGDSLLVVCDRSNLRVTLFRPNRELHRTLRLQRLTYGGRRGCVVDADGMLYQRVAVSGLGGAGENRVGARTQYLRMGIEGLVADSFYFGVYNPSLYFTLNTAEGPRAAFPTELVGGPYEGGGLLTGTTDRYRIVVRRVGAPVLVIERTHRPVGFVRGERSEWLAWTEYLGRERGRVFEIPRSKPAFRDLLSDPEGRIWVHLYTTATKRTNIPPRPPGNNRPLLTWREANVFDVIDRDGGYLGRAELPPEQVVMSITRDRLYASGPGPDGEDRVYVYRLPALAVR